jgi:hypothetical protein
MPSPFPGMDPFLEGYLWADVHQALANQIRAQLAPLISPRYVARLAVSVIEDETAEVEIGVMYPDVEIVEPPSSGKPRTLREASTVLLLPEAVTISPSFILPLNLKYRQVTVEIRDAGKNELVTSIEILSPVNKREPGLTKYREKRKRLYDAGVHLLEIDLLRRGTRVLSRRQVSQVPYAVMLTRAFAEQVQVWAIRLQDPLPTVPVPLRSSDPEVPLQLQIALTSIYDVARYDLTIDYAGTPSPPALAPTDETWMRELFQTTRTAQ